MTHKKAIFIFTRDRPQTLDKTLNSIQNVFCTKYVIDDSRTTQNQQSVFQLCRTYSNCVYLGKKAFNQFTSNHQINFPKFDFLLREVGRKEWNLGYARNFALLYSKSLGLEKVLFTDDDIEVPNLTLIEKLFRDINNYRFAGANILGLVDDSILGHIATNIGIMNERMLSGGFLVFNPNKIDHFFLNNYNEDWIWLFLQLKKERYLQTGEVYQELANPLRNYKNKIIFQEFGEIVLDGILDLYERDSYSELVQLPFWKRMIKEREEYLNLLLYKSIKDGKKKNKEIIEYIKTNSQYFKAITFKNLFEEYFYNRNLFQHLYNSLS
jgi:hypothetical protein